MDKLKLKSSSIYIKELNVIRLNIIVNLFKVLEVLIFNSSGKDRN